MSLSWFILADLKKEYLISQDISLEIWEEYIFQRPTTKLILNNTNEEIFLYDSEKNIVDSVSYKSSVKWEVIQFWTHVGDADMRPEDEKDTSKKEDIHPKDEDNSIEEEIPESSGMTGSGLEILFDLQRPSYVTQSGSSNSYICDSGREECKVNFNLESSFNDIFKKWDYKCEIDFGWVWEGEVEKCNPNTVIFPEWATEVVFKIIEKDTENEVITRSIKIIFDRSLPSIEEVTKISSSARLALRKPYFIVQSWLEWRGTNFYCKKQPCKFNLEYKKIHSWEACFWDFGPGTATSMSTRERCNPGYVTMPEGSFVLYLRVYERAFPSNQKNLKYFIHNIPEPALEIFLEEDSSVENEDFRSEVWETEELNMQITLQWAIWKEKTLSWNLLTCSDVEKCFVNFIAEWVEESETINFSWKNNTESFSNNINPKWIWLETWKHKIVFEASNSWVVLDTQEFHVSVTWKVPKSKTPLSTEITEFQEPILFSWVAIKKEESSELSLLPKWSFTQNYLVLKYDGLRISGKAPLWSKLEIYHDDTLIISGSIDEKWKYRLVSKDFTAWEYNFNTKLILNSGEEIILEGTKVADISAEQITLWNTPKSSPSRKKASLSSRYIPKTPNLIVKNTKELSENDDRELSILMRIFLSIIVCITLVFGWIHVLVTSVYFTPKSILVLYNVRFSTRQKVCLILS